MIFFHNFSVFIDICCEIRAPMCVKSESINTNVSNMSTWNCIELWRREFNYSFEEKTLARNGCWLSMVIYILPQLYVSWWNVSYVLHAYCLAESSTRYYCADLCRMGTWAKNGATSFRSDDMYAAWRQWRHVIKTIASCHYDA